MALRTGLAAIGDALRRLRIASPPQASVVVFHQDGSDVLQQTVLADMPFQVLDTRCGAWYLSWAVLRHFAGYWMQYGGERSAMPRGRRLRFTLGLALRVYQLSCLKAMTPKVVLTYIDNDYAFAWLSRRYPGAVFFAVQNGVRSPYDVSTWLPPSPHPSRVISMPHFFCYGEYERELYTAFGHTIDCFHPVGSLRASYYRHEFAARQNIAEKRDICLISQWFSTLGEPPNPLFPEIWPSLEMLHDYLNRYCEETGASLGIAMRSASRAEAEYFANRFGDKAQLIYNDRVNMSTYREIDASEVSVCQDSSAGREAFGWGTKVLFCNFTGHENYDFPEPGMWSLGRCSYQEFKSRLDEIRRIGGSDFRRMAEVSASKVMNISGAPAYKAIRQAVDGVLKLEK